MVGPAVDAAGFLACLLTVNDVVIAQMASKVTGLVSMEVWEVHTIAQLTAVMTALLGTAVVVCVVAKTGSGIVVGPVVRVFALRVRVGLSHFVSYV